jgi:hypothetical protein
MHQYYKCGNDNEVKRQLLHQKYVSASFSRSSGGKEVNGKNSSVVAAVLSALFNHSQQLAKFAALSDSALPDASQ